MTRRSRVDDTEWLNWGNGRQRKRTKWRMWIHDNTHTQHTKQHTNTTTSRGGTMKKGSTQAREEYTNTKQFPASGLTFVVFDSWYVGVSLCWCVRVCTGSTNMYLRVCVFNDRLYALECACVCGLWNWITSRLFVAGRTTHGGMREDVTFSRKKCARAWRHRLRRRRWCRRHESRRCSPFSQQKQT